MQLWTTATSSDEATRQARVAVLPVGSFEQHGPCLPLATDTVVASVVASAIAAEYDLFLLPPITIGCSHEHSGFAGTVSISARTLHLMISDIAHDLERSGIRKLVVVNGHGGNYVLSNAVQEANAAERRMLLYPNHQAWDAARAAAGCLSDGHSDMHAGELETSLLLHAAPELVRDGWEAADWQAAERPDLLLLGVAGYSTSGVIGTPSAASAVKGRAIVTSLTGSFAAHLKLLIGDDQAPQ